jgi:exosortase
MNGSARAYWHWSVSRAKTSPPPVVEGSASSQSVLTYFEIAIVGAVIAVLYAPILTVLFQDWLTDPRQSQGIIIPPLAACVAWLERRRMFQYPATHDRRGLLVIGAACVLFLVGRLAAEFFLTRLSFILLLAGMIWTYAGAERLRVLGFPLLLLSTMIPLPAIMYNSLVGRLQIVASTAGATIASRFGVAVYQEGNAINLAGLALGVDEACSGLHSLIALAVAGLVLGFVQNASTSVRVLLFIMALPLSIAINVVRVAGTAVMADTNEQFAMGFYHSFSGWLVFVCSFGCLFLLAKLLKATGTQSEAPQ